MKKFEIGKTYKMWSPCDHNCTWEYEVISRTSKTVTLKLLEFFSTSTHRINVYGDFETVLPLGKYSMSPSLRAENIVNQETKT